MCALRESIVVEPGDTLYIPRGVMHDAVARDTTSLHITLGVYAMTLQNVMLEMLQQTVEQDVDYRRSVPRALLFGSTDDKHWRSDVMDKCLSPGFTDEKVRLAVSSLLDEVAINTTQSVAGSLDRQPIDTLDLESEVRFRCAAVLSVERTAGHIRCRVQGQVLEFSGQMAVAFEQLFDADRICVGELSALDHDQQVRLCQQLYTANLLEILK